MMEVKTELNYRDEAYYHRNGIIRAFTVRSIHIYSLNDDVGTPHIKYGNSPIAELNEMHAEADVSRTVEGLKNKLLAKVNEIVVSEE